MNDDEDIIEQFRQIVELEPDSELTHFGLAQELSKAGRFAEAAPAYERAIEIKPDYSAAYRGLGCAYRQTNALDKARHAFTKGLEVATQLGDLQTKKEIEVFLKRLDEA